VKLKRRNWYRSVEKWWRVWR